MRLFSSERRDVKLAAIFIAAIRSTMEAFQGFNITVAGKSRFVPSHGMIKIMSAAGESTHTRRKSESAEKFQERIEADIAHRLKQQVRVRRAHTCSHSRCRIFYALTVLALPLQADLERQKSTRQYRSPEHARPVRQVGTTGKPSDESQTLTAPPPSKRSSAAASSASQPGDFGQAREREQQSRQKQDRIRMPPLDASAALACSSEAVSRHSFDRTPAVCRRRGAASARHK